METVNLLLPLTVALLLYFSPAEGVKCYRCYSPRCSQQHYNPSDCPHMCVSAVFKGFSQIAYEQQYQECADAAMCPKTGVRSFSMTTPKGFTIASFQCCNTDKCNAKFPQVPKEPPRGNVKCPRCEPGDENCNSVECNSMEDMCFKTKGTMGCASKNACAPKPVHEFLFMAATRHSLQSPLVCQEPEPPEPLEPLVRQCQMCLNPCHSCSKTTTVSVPQGMKCVAATVKDSVTGDVRVLKAIGGATLCSDGPGPQTFALSPISLAPLELLPKQYVQVTCCEDDNCNGDVPEFDELAPVQPVSQCANPELANQLHLLVSGAGMLPPSDCNGNLDPPN